MTSPYAKQTALVTGANSGLGFEAAGQLAEAGYGRIILACRTLEKAETARAALVQRVGSDPFTTVAVDVANISSSQAAAEELIARGHTINALLLNAGMVSGDDLVKSVDGLEMAFAASVIGHHVLTLRLLDANLLDGARVVLAGSEAAHGNLPGMMGMQLYDFAAGTPAGHGKTLPDAMLGFARAAHPELYVGTRYYATTKVFSAWWSAALARRAGGRLSVFTVSPGSNMGTNAARHTKGFKRLLFTKIMPLLGPTLGMDQPVPVGAKRYLDVLQDNGGPYANGGTYASRPKKFVGPLHKASYDHLADVERQEAAWTVLSELTGVSMQA